MWGVEAIWYKTEIKIIYFVRLCLIVLIVCDFMVYPDSKLFISKTLKSQKKILFLINDADFFLFFWSYFTNQDICNKFIEINFCVGRLTYVRYWWDCSESEVMLYQGLPECAYVGMSKYLNTIFLTSIFFSMSMGLKT